MTKLSPFAKANINATRQASCNTGTKHVTAGPLTMIYPGGGIYHIETASERHVRETCERLRAVKLAAGFAGVVTAAAKASAAVQAFGAAVGELKAPKPRTTSKVARLVVGMATRTGGKRTPRSAASRINDARYQWLKRRLLKAGVTTITVRGGTVRAAMELLWQDIVLSA